MSPKGVVMEKVRSSPPSSEKRCTSVMGVPPRSSSSAKVRAASSTSKTSVPTPSGWTRSQRQARPPSPAGSEQTTRTPPASKTAERCRPVRSSSAEEAPVSAKSSRSV